MGEVGEVGGVGSGTSFRHRLADHLTFVALLQRAAVRPASLASGSSCTKHDLLGFLSDSGMVVRRVRCLKLHPVERRLWASAFGSSGPSRTGFEYFTRLRGTLENILGQSVRAEQRCQCTRQWATLNSASATR